MLFNFDYIAAGFKEEEWEDIPRPYKVIIRDWHVHRGDSDQVMLFNYYDTDQQIRRAENIYELRMKPMLQISLANFSF